MLIIFHCSNCKSKLEIEAERASSEVVCPTCGVLLIVPRKGIGPGTTLGGFRIDRLIGRGGMGEVYLATQLSLDRPVALKILPSQLSMKEENSLRFFNEIRALAQLRHDSIVTAYEAGEDSGILFLAMAYVPGESLEARLDRRGKLREREALEIVAELVSALDYAWQQHRLLHRDIKPSNILFNKYGRPLLVDFGLAKTVKDTVVSLTQSSAIIGTPNYMSPERVSSASRVDFRADMYSLGATLYHMLTAHTPFEADNVMEVLRKQASESLSDPRALNPEVSGACVRLMDIMLAKDPEHRHDDWESLGADVDRVLAGEWPLKAPPPRGHTIRVKRHRASPEDVAPYAGWRSWAAAVTRRWEYVLPTTIAAVALVLLGVVIAGQRKVSGQAQGGEAIGGGHAPTELAAETERLVVLEDRYVGVLRHVRENPGDYVGATARFRALKAASAGTALEHRAADAMGVVTARRAQAVREAGASLTATVTKCLAEGRYSEARAALDMDVGQLEEDLRELKSGLAGQVAQKVGEAAARKAEEEAKQAALSQAALDDAHRAELTAAVSNVVLASASSLLDGKYARTLRVLERFGGDGGVTLDETLAETVQFLTTLGSLPNIILASFEAEKGAKATIEFKDGRTEALLVVGVESGAVKAREQFAEGYVQKDFGLDDLSVREKWRRLGSDNSPERSAMRGLLAAEAGYWDKALSHFAEVSNRVGEVFVELAEERRAEVAEAVAGRAIEMIVGVAGLDPAIGDADALAAGVAQKSYGSNELQRVRVALEEFAERHVGTRVAEENAALLAALSAKAGVAAPATPSREEVLKGRLDAALEALRQANPGMEALESETSISQDGIVLRLKGQELKDIRAIAGLPVRTLDLSHTLVTDLACLAGMPLAVLSLAETPVTTVSALAGLPLKRLDLAGTQIHDATPLKAMVGLEDLDLSRTPVSDMTPLAGLKLKRLLMSETKITNLAAVVGMPLRELDISGTLIDDLSALKGVGLVRLVASSAPVRDLAPLEGMPLVVLDISGTPVERLAPLQGLPITTLNILGCESLVDLDRLPEYVGGLTRLTIDTKRGTLELARRFGGLTILHHGGSRYTDLTTVEAEDAE